MRTLTASLVVIVILAFTAHAPSRAGQASAPADAQQACAPLGSSYMRTTLYFGLMHKTGSVSESEWQAFLRSEVTPRFPQGLTVWEANGQWRRADGRIARERAKVLLLVHDDSAAVRALLGEIVTSYKRLYKQESVLWESARVCAAF